MKRLAVVVGCLALATLFSMRLSLPSAVGGPITPTGWRPPLCGSGSGIAATGSGLGYGCTSLDKLVNDALTGMVPTTTDGSGDLGPSGIHDTGSGAAAQISFDNGPTGVNNYNGTTFQWSEEWLTALGDSGAAWVPNSAPYAVAGNGLFRARASGSGVVSLYTVACGGRPGCVEMLVDASKGLAAGFLEWSDTSAQTFELGSGSVDFHTVLGFPVLGTTTAASSYTWWGGVNHNTNFGGCEYFYDPAGIALSLIPGAGQDLIATCAVGTSSSRTSYVLNGSGSCDVGAKGTVAAGAVTWPSTNVLNLEIVESASDAKFYANGSMVCDINTNLAASTTPLTIAQNLVTNATSSATIKIDYDFTSVTLQLAAARSP